jgi:hypothetical protein
MVKVAQYLNNKLFDSPAVHMCSDSCQNLPCVNVYLQHWRVPKHKKCMGHSRPIFGKSVEVLRGASLVLDSWSPYLPDCQVKWRGSSLCCHWWPRFTGQFWRFLHKITSGLTTALWTHNFQVKTLCHNTAASEIRQQDLLCIIQLQKWQNTLSVRRIGSSNFVYFRKSTSPPFVFCQSVKLGHVTRFRPPLGRSI